MANAKLYTTRNTLPEPVREQAVALLQEGLVFGVDLERQAKQAHWNVKGPNFIALHELFDEMVTAAIEYTDTCAERLVALGGVADGTVQTVAKTTALTPAYPVSIRSGFDHVNALAAALAAFGAFARGAIDKASAFGDADTADLFTGISRGLDQNLWKVEAHHEPV